MNTAIPGVEVDRFLSKVRKTETCWVWQGAIDAIGGYGVFKSVLNLRYAHRWAYVWKHGAIPAGLVIDHLCNNRRCVNPDHLRAVTQRENVERSGSITNVNRRKTHCIRGHAFDAKNTYIRAGGARKCKACHTLREREKRK